MDQILEILENNARVSNSDIAKMTGLSVKDVEKQIRKLEDKGVIVKYKAVVDRDLVEQDTKVRALIEVRVSPQKNVGFDAVAARIYKFPEVRDCYLLSGGYDLHLVVEGDDLHSVAKFVSEKLASLEHVQGTTTNFLLKKYKDDGVILKKPNGKRLAVTP